MFLKACVIHDYFVFYCFKVQLLLAANAGVRIVLIEAFKSAKFANMFKFWHIFVK